MSSSNRSPLQSRALGAEQDAERRGARLHALEGVWRPSILFAIPVILLLLVPTPLLPVAFAVAPLYFVLRWLALGSPFPRTQINPFLLVLLATFAIVFALSPKYPEGIVIAADLIAGVLILFVVLDHVHSVRGMWSAAMLLVLIGAGLAVITPFTVPFRGAPMIPIPFFYEQNWTLLFETTNGNVMAGALAPILLIALACLRVPERRIRAAAALALVPITLILFLLQVRGAWLGVAVGLIVWAALYNRWLVPALPLLLLGALALNNALGGMSPADFLYGPVGTELSESVDERQELWGQAVRLLSQSPLFGIGVGGYTYVAPFAPPFAERGLKDVPHAHHLFLQVGLDTGIIGLLSFVAFWLALAVGVWRGYRGSVARDLAIGVLAAMAVIVTHGWGDSIFWGFKAAFIMWFVLALALLFDKRNKKIYNATPLL
ncbi:MAG: O-antigen ligase family protein [Anaerolineae bacterium]|nr:O-antigen ligase family protein [Anaerolineae bacterium]